MTDTPETIMARAAHTSCSEQDVIGYLDADIDCAWLARVQLEALKEAGWAICPVEPTEAMIQAGMMNIYDYSGNTEVRDIWDDMIEEATKEKQ